MFSLDYTVIKKNYIIYCFDDVIHTMFRVIEWMTVPHTNAVITPCLLSPGRGESQVLPGHFYYSKHCRFPTLPHTHCLFICCHSAFWTSWKTYHWAKSTSIQRDGIYFNYCTHICQIGCYWRVLGHPFISLWVYIKHRARLVYQRCMVV